jgi:DNA repair exonuclease SbcCD ATPase subunit
MAEKPQQERKPVAEKPSSIDKALKAMEELEGLKQAAIDELLEQRKDIDSKLAKLGYGEPKAKAPAAKKDQTKPCTICKFLTVPPHDGRVHRSQGEHKKPFTDAELAQQGLKKA